MSIPSGSANQIPTAQSAAVVPPLVTTCANVSNADAGPPVGTELPAAVVVEEPDRQDLYRSGTKIGTATEFVEFDNGQMVIKEVAGYLRAMIDAAAANGVTIWTSSGFRTFAKQEELVREKGLASQGGLAAAAGYSNHQNANRQLVEHILWKLRESFGFPNCRQNQFLDRIRQFTLARQIRHAIPRMGFERRFWILTLHRQRNCWSRNQHSVSSFSKHSGDLI